jgi:hypothetical protein
MMSIAKLKTELTDDPLERGYSSMTAEEASASLNTVNRTRLVALSMQELREWAGINARGFNILAGISNEALTDQQRNICCVADKLIGTDDGKLDPGNALHVAMINELVSAGVISAADRTALVAKATDDISRATELGLGKVRVGHIQETRS